MNTYNYTYENNKFKRAIDYDLFKDKKNILIQIFCGNNEHILKDIIEVLYENIPLAVVIGTTTDGEIKNKKVSTLKAVVSISVFENTSIEMAIEEGEDFFHNGFEIAKKIVKPNTKLIITFTDGTRTNAEEYLKGIHSFNKSIMVCGGMAGDNGLFKETFISCGKKIISFGAIAISLNSDVLEVSNDYKYDWSPIGIEHTINKVKGNRIYEISGMKAIDFYEKYLGDGNSHTEFPLIVQRNGIFIARAVLTRYEDGSLGCGGNLYKGEKVKLGFANAEMIIKKPFEYFKKIYDYPTETFFVYSCMARRRYMRELIEIEMEPFSLIAPTSGFFTYAEFFHTSKENALMNQTITIVGLTENPNIIKKIPKSESLISQSNSSYAKTIQALTHLIQQSAKDQSEQAQILQEQIKYSENLIKNQKRFLRYAIHETNTPLSVIMGNIDLHEMHYNKNEYLSNIEVAMKNIFSIYDDLSYLVKRDHIEYKIHKIDLVDFVRSRIYFFKSVAQQMSSVLEFESSLKQMFIYLSEIKLQRIVDNTLSNAIKYTKKGKIISINLEEVKDTCIFTVSSHSKKIQEPEKIFEEYYREEESKDGFGLGLNLVKRICDEEGILVEVKSDSKNTSFRYILKVRNENITS